MINASYAMTKPDYPLVLVEWRDSRQPSAEWHWADEYETPALALCRTVGWLIDENKEAIAIAQSLGGLSDDRKQVCGVIIIGQGQVLRVTEIGTMEEHVQKDPSIAEWAARFRAMKKAMEKIEEIAAMDTSCGATITIMPPDVPESVAGQKEPASDDAIVKEFAEKLRRGEMATSGFLATVNEMEKRS
jgi:hypothetical protein